RGAAGRTREAEIGSDAGQANGLRIVLRAVRDGQHPGTIPGSGWRKFDAQGTAGARRQSGRAVITLREVARHLDVAYAHGYLTGVGQRDYLGCAGSSKRDAGETQ